MNPITEFKGEFRWLSNFSPVDINFDGDIFPSVEHAYVAAKIGDKSVREELIAMTAGQAKRFGRKFPLAPDWGDIKITIMKALIHRKFEQEPYRSKLLATGDVYIQEGNTWGDKYWGVCLRTGEGNNFLGQLIMHKRENLRYETD